MTHIYSLTHSFTFTSTHSLTYISVHSLPHLHQHSLTHLAHAREQRCAMLLFRRHGHGRCHALHRTETAPASCHQAKLSLAYGRATHLRMYLIKASVSAGLLRCGELPASSPDAPAPVVSDCKIRSISGRSWSTTASFWVQIYTTARRHLSSKDPSDGSARHSKNGRSWTTTPRHKYPTTASASPGCTNRRGLLEQTRFETGQVTQLALADDREEILQNSAMDFAVTFAVEKCR
jgi:hypothetical protein